MRKALIIALVFVLVMHFTGCYDNRETDTLATVMAVGIDKSGQAGFKTYTFAVADTGGLAGSDKGDGTSLICFTAEGKNAYDAIDELDGKISKELSFSHISVILFSESAAAEDMYEDVDYFEKKISVRPQTMIAVTDIKAGDYLNNLKPVLEANPEKYFESIFKNNKADIGDMSISDFTNAYYTKKKAFAPVISTVYAKDGYSEMNSIVDKKVCIYEGRIIKNRRGDT